MGRQVGAVSTLAAAVWLGGCASEPPAAAQLSRMPSERPLDTLLSEDEQAEVLSAMESVAEGHAAPPADEIYVREMRWSDIPRAVGVACDKPGVEMVVLDQVEHDSCVVFRMRTADDRPATLELRRTNDERLYEASARVGRFDFAKDRERAARLLEEIDRAMQGFGEKRRLAEDSRRDR